MKLNGNEYVWLWSLKSQVSRFLKSKFRFLKIWNSVFSGFLNYFNTFQYFGQVTPVGAAHVQRARLDRSVRHFLGS